MQIKFSARTPSKTPFKLQQHTATHSNTQQHTAVSKANAIHKAPKHKMSRLVDLDSDLKEYHDTDIDAKIKR